MLDKWLKRKITEALETNEIVLCPEENRKEQKELFKMMDIIERVELYHSWCDPTTVGNVTKGMTVWVWIKIFLKALLLNGTTSISLNELMRGDRGKRHIIFFLISSSERYTKCLDAQFFAKYFIFKARQDQVHSYLQIYNVRPIYPWPWK